MLQLWMTLRYMREGRRFMSPSILLAVFGIALGVAALVISMAVVSGYETTLKRTLINMHGHLMVVRHGGVDNQKDMDDDVAKLKQFLPTMKAITPFLVVEGLIVHQKKLSGIALEGVDPKSVGDVIALQSRLVDGEFNLSVNAQGVSGAVIGKGIAKKFSLKLGDQFRLVIPVGHGQHIENFRPKAQSFVVHGIVDLGRADYDERYIVTDIESAQRFGETTGRISGWRIKLASDDQAIPAAKKLEEELGPSFWVRSWRDPNRNLFEAVQYEKTVIFIIVSLMVVAAAFNVASTLYLIVVRRYSQISILLAMGVRKRFIRWLFSIQGLVIGFAGTLCGLLLGWIGCRIFLWLETMYGLFPGEVYKLDHVDLEIRFADIGSILVVTLGICYIATLAPARRGAKLTPVEGLKYE